MECCAGEQFFNDISAVGAPHPPAAPDATHAAAEPNDELVHRINIVGRVTSLYDTMPSDQRDDWIAKLLAADDEVQTRFNPYLRAVPHRQCRAGLAVGPHQRGGDL